MSQRITNSIIKNIERLVAQILKIENDGQEKLAEMQRKYAAKINPLKDKIEKFEAMLELLNLPPAVSHESQATLPEGETAPASLPKEGDTGTTTLEEIFQNPSGKKHPFHEKLTHKETAA